MKTQERPTAVLVIAILHFVFGGLGLLGGLGGCASILCMGAIFGAMPQPKQGVNPMTEITRLYDSIPGFYPVMIGQSVVGAILGTVLIAAGIGLLKLRPWARTASIGYAIAEIVVTLAATVYTLSVVNPAVEKWMVEFNEKMSQQMGPGAGGPPPTMPMMSGGSNTAITILSALVSVAYAVVVLVVMNLTPVREAFAGARGRGLGRYEKDEGREEHEPEDEPAPRPRRSREDDDRYERGPDR
jgi:hypothetical protein